MNTPSPALQVQQITEQHAALALDSHTDPLAQPASAAAQDVAYAAARRLGFIDTDAHCVATAWARQTERTGHFDTQAWPSNPRDFGIAPAGGFAPCPQALGLYAVLPSADWVGRMARAGVPTLQLRFKHSDVAIVQHEVQAAVDAVQGTGAKLFINDHWQAAIAAGAYGVHLGQEDLDTLSGGDLAAMRQAGLRLGLSTHGYAEMVRAARIGPSYLALGAVFPTTLKAMATVPQGPSRLGAYAQLLQGWSLVAIGGVGAEHLPTIAATGVGSVAVVRAIVAAAQPEQAAQGLMAQWAACRHGLAT
jgi:thiamine-phosphate pyrophosphorylase